MLGYVKDTGFMLYALIEAQGRENELISFPVVQIVANGESVMIDVSQRCARVPTGMYVYVFLKLTVDEARTLAYSDSFGIIIKLSDDAPVFLGMASMDTMAGKEQLHAIFRLAGMSD